MAAQVKLVRRGDYSGDISSLSLFNYEDGFSLARNGWIQAAAGSDDRVIETLTLHVEASSHDDLASKLQALDDKIREYNWYNDAVECYGIWLRAQMTDESEARQAFVTNIRGEPGVSFYAPPVAPGNFMREGYTLTLERVSWWESVSTQAKQGLSVNCLGGTYDLTTGGYPLVVGTEPARIATTTFGGVSGGGGPLNEFWIGFRTDRFGAQANFVPVWECEDGTLANSTSSVVDATAHDGYKAQCTFSSEAILARATIAVEDVTNYHSDQRGEYNVLLRAKVGSDTTCHVRLLDGFTSTDDWRTQSRQVITSTSWLLYPLGTVKIPPARGRTGSSFLQKFALRIEADRTSGSGNLDMDCLILIPTAEGALHVEGGLVQYVSGDNRPIIVRVYQDDSAVGWGYSGTYPVRSTVVDRQNYALPTGACTMVLAGQRSAEQDKDDFVSVFFSIFSRFRTLRGAE